MKLLVATLLTALLAFVSGLYFPWWSLAVTTLLVGVLVHQRPGKAFFGGFLGIFLLWGGLAWMIDMKNNAVLSARISELLPLGGSSVLLILVTALVGALAGGLGAMTGSFLRSTE